MWKSWSSMLLLCHTHAVGGLPCSLQPTASICLRWSWRLKEYFSLASAVEGKYVGLSVLPYPTVMPWWWVLTRTKQLFKAATAWVIWLHMCKVMVAGWCSCVPLASLFSYIEAFFFIPVKRNWAAKRRQRAVKLRSSTWFDNEKDHCQVQGKSISGKHCSVDTWGINLVKPLIRLWAAELEICHLVVHSNVRRKNMAAEEEAFILERILSIF